MSLLPVDDMKILLNYAVSERDIKKHQSFFEEQVASGNVEPSTKFQYAWCLIHSKNYSDVKKGALLFEEIFKAGSEEVKRDALFYLALAETRQKNYCTADKYLKGFLSVEPNNVQAQQLQTYVKTQLKKDGLKGMALFGAMGVLGGGAAVVLGTVAIGVAAGIALTKKMGK